MVSMRSTSQQGPWDSICSAELVTSELPWPYTRSLLLFTLLTLVDLWVDRRLPVTWPNVRVVLSVRVRSGGSAWHPSYCLLSEETSFLSTISCQTKKTNPVCSLLLTTIREFIFLGTNGFLEGEREEGSWSVKIRVATELSQLTVGPTIATGTMFSLVQVRLSSSSPPPTHRYLVTHQTEFVYLSLSAPIWCTHVN